MHALNKQKVNFTLNKQEVNFTLNVYNAETAPVANFYKALGKFKSINGFGSLEEITDRLVKAIG